MRSRETNRNLPCDDVKIRNQKADEEVLKALKEMLRRILREEELVLQKKKQQVPSEDQIRAAERALETLNRDKKLVDWLADRSINMEEIKKKEELDGEIGEVRDTLAL